MILSRMTLVGRAVFIGPGLPQITVHVATGGQVSSSTPTPRPFRKKTRYYEPAGHPSDLLFLKIQNRPAISACLFPRTTPSPSRDSYSAEMSYSFGRRKNSQIKITATPTQRKIPSSKGAAARPINIFRVLLNSVLI